MRNSTKPNLEFDMSVAFYSPVIWYPRRAACLSRLGDRLPAARAPQRHPRARISAHPRCASRILDSYLQLDSRNFEFALIGRVGL